MTVHYLATDAGERLVLVGDPAPFLARGFTAYPSAASFPRTAKEAAEAARQADKQAIRQAAQLRALLVATPNEIDARIEAQVTDLESAKEILKILARGLSLAIREQLEE